MITLSKRLTLSREARKLSQTDLAKLVKREPQTIQKIESGETEQPRLDLVYEISQKLNINPAWLVFGDEYVHIPSRIQSFAYYHIPIINWNDVIDLEKTKRDIFPIKDDTEVVPLIRNDGLKPLFGLRIKGDAMTSDIPGKRSFLEGEIIIIDPDRPYKPNDYVVIHQKNSEEAILRKYVAEGASHAFRPLNRAYEAIHLNKDIKICGVAIEIVDSL